MYNSKYKTWNWKEILSIRWISSYYKFQRWFMRKMLFNLGDLSQLTGVLVPVYQVRNMDIFKEKNPKSNIVIPQIDFMTPTRIMSINEPFFKEFDKNFASLDEKSIFSKEFSKNL
ncbi:hypothetical protein DR088_00220 [Mycoplasma hyopneumoniae]|nr:hypothetical protein [Mesomycoplasma hyopneumoniae]MXR63870.1 hypothetical protein [Mesomycoplasma hyopneumoniae]